MYQRVIASQAPGTTIFASAVKPGSSDRSSSDFPRSSRKSHSPSSDTAGKLNSDEDRRAWAVNYGIISKKTELSANCDVQQACTIIKNYLEVLEDLNKVTFTKLVRKGTVRENAISLNLATAKTFDGNRNLHRYDLAAICRLIARLDYKG